MTARVGESAQVLRLECRADNLESKPCIPHDVMARLRTVLQDALPRSDGSSSRVYRVGNLEIDTGTVRVRLSGEVLPMTPAEFRLLVCMASSPGRAFTRAELLAAALPGSEARERVVDAHMGSARRKLEAGGGSGLLQTVRAVGYRLTGDG
ncbi:response regulator transcription factor [Deinococcus ruber]|nr:response regulator transcription factor [Deinococcus ruber]